MSLLLFFACASDPDAPPEVAFDHVSCDECGMLVSEPQHAAALITTEGKTLTFDDPGCLFRYVVKNGPHVARLWFHDASTWLRESETAFLPGGTTPMGSGLVTVPAGTPGALTVGEASNRVLAP